LTCRVKKEVTKGKQNISGHEERACWCSEERRSSEGMRIGPVAGICMRG
jgi:hypothetical protein